MEVTECRTGGPASRLPIVYWNREKAREETELVYGDTLVRTLYSNPIGQKIADLVLSRPSVSRLVGLYQSSPVSRRKISRFVDRFQISMDEYEKGPFSSFNQFFIRKFRAGARSFVQEPGLMPAFAEARYLGFKAVDPAQSFPVKGEDLSAESILGSMTDMGAFRNGPMLIARLCPTDYHRFHFPDTGTVIANHRIHGKLHSVNPIALNCKSDILASNERHVTLLDTRNFGKLAYVEVGAMCVGRIVQTHSWSQPFERGDEKGYFLFGASTVILLGEPDRWIPDADILKNSSNRMETYIRLGDRVASSKTSV